MGAVIGWWLAKILIRLQEKVDCKYVEIIVSISVMCFTLLSFCNQQYKAEQMRMCAALNNRADGFVNLLILNGENGYVGKTMLYVTYTKDASITISGSCKVRSWEIIGELVLPAGKYTFAGMSGVQKNTVASELKFYSEKHKNFICLTPDIGPIESFTFILENQPILEHI